MDITGRADCCQSWTEGYKIYVGDDASSHLASGNQLCFAAAADVHLSGSGEDETQFTSGATEITCTSPVSG